MSLIPNITVALPEIFILIMACFALLASLFSQKNQAQITFVIVQLALIGAASITLALYNEPASQTFFGMYTHDRIACLLKLIIYLTSFFAFLYARQYVQERKIAECEYYILGLFCVLGMMVLVSATNLLVLFLGLELLSLPLYAMVAMQRESGIACEAAMKYYITGSLASAILLYGISLLYGITGAIDFATIAQNPLTAIPGGQFVFYVALVFVLAGVAFKLGAAPFHVWAPDVYQGAPTSVTLLVGSAPKIAAMGMAIRLLVDAMPNLALQWQELLIIIALASMILGNIVAIIQTNIKRMLAYSSIAHMGYASLGLLVADPSGYAATIFYIFMYALMAMGAFAVIIMLSREGFEAEQINDLRGLNSRSPWLALMMLLLMFSMAGIPPTVGFFAKLGVLEAVVHAGFVWLAVVAIIAAVIGSYYYLAIVKVMYFEEPTSDMPLTFSSSMNIAISINGLAILALGIFPSSIIELCRHAFFIPGY